MNEYAVLIFGEGYWLAKENEPTKEHDFLVWRCIHAESEAKAERIALQMVRDDESLNVTVRNPPDNPPKLAVNEIRQGFGDLTPPGSGYIFYRSEDDEASPPRGFLSMFAGWFRRTRN